MEKKHTHKLKKVKYKSGNATYFCVLDCPYKVSPALALGKKSICWRCGDEFILNEYTLRLVKPHCDSCHQSKKKDAVISTEVIGTVNPTMMAEISLAERLKQTIAEKQAEQEEDI